MERGCPTESRNGLLETKLRFLMLFASAVAAVVAFAWASQARQDEAIRRNETAIAVVSARLDAICEKLEELRAILLRDRAPEKR